MATKNINNKSSLKGIRFPHELIDKISKRVEQEAEEGLKTNFSSWVIDACESKLKKARNSPKE